MPVVKPLCQSLATCLQVLMFVCRWYENFVLDKQWEFCASWCLPSNSRIGKLILPTMSQKIQKHPRFTLRSGFRNTIFTLSNCPIETLLALLQKLYLVMWVMWFTILQISKGSLRTWKQKVEAWGNGKKMAAVQLGGGEAQNSHHSSDKSPHNSHEVFVTCESAQRHLPQTAVPLCRRPACMRRRPF